MLDQSGLEEILELISNMKKFNTLYPYEKEYTLRRCYELVMKHRVILGDPLTEKALYAMLTLWNSSDASR